MSEPSLAQRARMAVAWTTAVQVLRDVVQFGIMLVLVRRLPLEAYGEFGLINTIVSFMLVFSSREFIGHTLLIRDDGDVNYDEQFLAGCVIQSVLFVVCNIVGVVLRWFPAYVPVAPLLNVMSLTFLLDLPSELRTRMLERSLDWERLRTVEAVGVVSAAVLSIVLGVGGAGVYALLIPSFIVPGAFLIDLFVIAKWRPKWEWHPERYHASRRFGFNRVISVSFVSASNLLESSILAKAVGYAMLGVFGRAVGIANLFCQRVATLLMMSLYPVLARIAPASDGYRRVSALVLRVIAWSVVPMALVVSLLRSDIVQTLYGDRWLAVIPLVPWGMALGALLAIVQGAYSLLLAHDQARQCLYADVWRLVGMATALLAALPFGLPSYFGALLVVHTIAFSMVVFWLLKDRGLSMDGVADALTPAATAGVVAVLAAEGLFRLWFHGWPVIPRMIAFGVVFGGTYLGCLRLFFASLLYELLGYLPQASRVQRLLGFAEAA